MSYTVDIAIDLGDANTGLTLEALLVDTAGADTGSAITTGFAEIGGGHYLWHYAAMPESHRGGVRFYESGDLTTATLFFEAISQLTYEATISTSGYCSVAEVKSRLGITDTDDDTAIEAVISAVEELINQHCGRRFDQRAAETRYYTTKFGDRVDVDDLVSVTTLTTDDDDDRSYGTTWQATDFELEPVNAATDGKPYYQICTTPDGDWTFPTSRRGVKVIGTFGWPAVPDAVREAAIIQTARLWKRGDAPFGVTGSPEFGMIRIARLDPDVKALLDTVMDPRVLAL